MSATVPWAEMMDAIRVYIDVATGDDDYALNERLHALCLALDGLALAYHRTPEGALESDNEPPSQDYTEVYQTIGRRFPALGHYASVTPEMNPDAKTGLRDAIDDLTDIARDLMEVAWRWENTSSIDAAGHFRFGYQTHWGRHLHDVRGYLHFVLFES